MLAGIKHAADVNFVFFQDSQPAHRACNTIELLQDEIVNDISSELWSQTAKR